MVTLLTLVASLATVRADTPSITIARSPNPDPARLPTLSVGKFHPETFWAFLAADFPEPKGCVLMLAMYEVEHMTFVGARPLEGGKIEIRHRSPPQPGVDIVTVATPEPGSVEVVARLEPSSSAGKKDAARVKITGELNSLNICFQLTHAAGFQSKPEPYPDFVKRCFIFTEKGRTFLHETQRQPDQRKPLEAKENNPPWIQRYLKVGRRIPDKSILEGKSWIADSDPTVALNTAYRFTVPVIGAISRDGKYLAATANGSATRMAQAWGDCVHNSPPWLPLVAPPEKRTWRVKAYVMKNDPKALLERVKRDFPELKSSASKTDR
jgi:hypothetical protein